MLLLVVQRRIRAAELMQEAFGHVETIAEDSRFRVLRSASPVT
jgi:16S rRNA G1207 methylase RsmC